MNAASRGDADVHYNVGYMYQTGYGVKRDMAMAVSWYVKAAENGYVRAQHLLGDIYFFGYGVEKDREKALRWFRAAALAGDSYSQDRLLEIGEHI